MTTHFRMQHSKPINTHQNTNTDTITTHPIHFKLTQLDLATIKGDCAGITAICQQGAEGCEDGDYFVSMHRSDKDAVLQKEIWLEFTLSDRQCCFTNITTYIVATDSFVQHEIEYNPLSGKCCDNLENCT